MKSWMVTSHPMLSRFKIFFRIMRIEGDVSTSTVRSSTQFKQSHKRCLCSATQPVSLPRWKDLACAIYSLVAFTTKQKPKQFIEPFAGGGIVSLTVAAEQLAQHVTMVELDEDVAAVWQTVLNGYAVWLGEKICAFDLTSRKVDLALKSTCIHSRKAFQTILKNRVNHGGILAAGAGRIKEGEGGKGSAFTLVSRNAKTKAIGDR